MSGAEDATSWWDPANPNYHHPEVRFRRRRHERILRERAQRDAEKPKCIWRNCPKEPGHSYPGLPLCDAHVQIVYDAVSRPQRLKWAEWDAQIAARKAAAKDDLGWIYYVKIGEHIKVGYATHLQNRLSAYPPTSKLLASHRGTRDDEAALHRRFVSHCVAGREWYAPHQEILDHVAAVIAEHGEPAHDPFSRRRSNARKNTLGGSGPQKRRRSKGSGIRAA